MITIHRMIFLVLGIILSYQSGLSQNCAKEQYFMTQAVDPSNEEAFWHMGKDEAQGVANDGANWFISTAHLVAIFPNKVYDNGTLWRIPLTVDLGINSTPAGVKSISASDIPELRDLNYTHFGDPDCYTYNGTSYILVPTYSGKEGGPNNGAIACFRASDLAFINFAWVVGEQPGFCFVDDDGNIYVKKNQTALTKYTAQWEQLTNSNDSEHDLLKNPCTINLGLVNSGLTEIDVMQGGEISDSGKILFLTSGSADGFGNQESSDGINLFQITSNDCNATWNWIASSENDDNASVPFTFLFNNGLGGTQSPQGVTFWDIDDPDVSDKVRGKVHVLLFDYETTGGHNVYFYHFSDFIHVDGVNGLIKPERRIGGIAKPFKYFNDAFFHYPAWDGATIVLKAGNYKETGTYDKCILIKSEGGPAIIGQ